MSAPAAHPLDRIRRHQGSRGPAAAARSLALALAVTGLLTACAEEPLPQRRISADDCLNEVRMERLKEALERCDKVVAAYPNDPLPLNERYVLHTLAEDDKAACRDLAQALALAGRIPAGRLDPILRHDLQIRRADCVSAGLGAGMAPSPALQQLPHKNR